MRSNRSHKLKVRLARARRIDRGRRAAHTIVLVALALVSVLTESALGYLTDTGSANAGAVVGALAAPTITSATPGAGTVSLSWSAVTAPAGGTVTYYVTRAGGTVGGNCPSSATSATASTTCTDSGLSRGTYNYTVTAVWQSWTSTSSSSGATLASGALDHFAVGTPGTQTAGAAFNVTVTAEDVAGNTVTAYSGSQALTFSGPASSLSGSAPTYPASVTFSSGVGTGSVTLYDAQSTTLTATQGPVTGTSGSFTVNAGANHQIVASAGASQVAGTAFNVTLTAEDTWDNATGTLSGTKSLTFSGPSNAPGGGAPVYPGTASFSSGVATASVTLKDAQTTTITVTDTSDGFAAATTNSITVAPAGASSFTVPTPATQTAGVAFNETLSAFDAYGNAATGYSGAQTVSFTGPANSPNATQPTRSASVTFSSGVGTASLILYDAQNTTLTATQGSVTGASGSFTVAPAGASSFTVPTPATQTAGVAFNETMTALDAYGNTDTGYTGSKTVSFTGPSNSPDATQPTGSASVTFSSGVGTASLTLYDAESTTLTATQGSVAGTSGTFTVDHGANHQIGATAGAAQVAGTAFSVTLTSEDTWGNTTGTLSGTKSLSFTGPNNAPGGGTPTYPGTVNFSAGVATASVTLKDAQTTTIHVTDTTDGYAAAITNSITVAPAGANSFTVPTPATQTAGTAFNETLTALDVYGNTATGYTGSQSVTFSGPSNAPSGTQPTRSASVTFTSGVGTASLTLYDAQSTTLTATQGSVTGTSGSFTVSAASASQLVFTTQPGNVTHGSAFGTQPVVKAEDPYDNVATSFGTTAALSKKTGPGGSTLTGCSPSFSAGVTTFSGCKVSTAGSGYSLKATAGALSVISATFTAS